MLRSIVDDNPNELKLVVGYFVIGWGKFGEYCIGQQFIELSELSKEFWEERGYEFAPVYLNQCDINRENGYTEEEFLAEYFSELADTDFN